MKLRSSIVWIVAFILFVSMATMAGQRGGGGGGGRGGGGGNPRGDRGGNPTGNNPDGGNNPRGGRGRENLPPEGSVREDTIKVVNKARPMLEIVEALQRRSGRPISYEDPQWSYEGTKTRDAAGKIIDTPGDIKRVEGFQTTPGVAAKAMLSLMPGNYDFKLVVDARTHVLQEPIDGSLGAVIPALIADYSSKKLPGIYGHRYLGNVNEPDGLGWMVGPAKVKNREGLEVEAVRVLDYPITFPTEQRTTVATMQLIVDLVSKASGQPVQFKKLATEANMTGGTTTTKPVDLPAKQTVRIGATNETARSVILKALRIIQRGDPRTEPPIPERAYRLLYSIDTRTYYLNLETVRQENFRVNGESTGTRPVNWPTPGAPTAAAGAPAPAAATAP
jgi:hypothetical protein